MTDRVVTGRKQDEDAALENSLRPRRLAEYIGQGRATFEQVDDFAEATWSDIRGNDRGRHCAPR